MKPNPLQLITVGRIGAVYGVRGWLRIHSFTSPPDALFGYLPWYLNTRQGLRQVAVSDWQDQSKGPVALLTGVEDREAARLLTGLEIQVEKSVLPELDSGEFYWHQLIGMQVVAEFEGNRQNLGQVENLLETGANDVLVVAGEDGRERLIPYLPDQVVKTVDLKAATITVDWDPDF